MGNIYRQKVWATGERRILAPTPVINDLIDTTRS